MFTDSRDFKFLRDISNPNDSRCARENDSNFHGNPNGIVRSESRNFVQIVCETLYRENLAHWVWSSENHWNFENYLRSRESLVITSNFRNPEIHGLIPRIIWSRESFRITRTTQSNHSSFNDSWNQPVIFRMIPWFFAPCDMILLSRSPSVVEVTKPVSVASILW